MSTTGAEASSLQCCEKQQPNNVDTSKFNSDVYIGTMIYDANSTSLNNAENANVDSGGIIESAGITSENNELSISIMQSSPPPHSYRHSRAYRHFKNPPQPHMCIRTTTESGEELFINVLSWTRIVIPQEPSDPIPLYGGMRVPAGSPRSPPIVFAVMANPEVLKDSGRHSKDPEERRAMVELMCDFVEAMNPGVKLVRNAVILKDRDISGELKDVWNAVQAQRDREREEQIMQQRQQQQYHNTTTQMFPKSPDTAPTIEQNTEEEKLSSTKTIDVDKIDDDFTAIVTGSDNCGRKMLQDGEKSILSTSIIVENDSKNVMESDDQIDSVGLDGENANLHEIQSVPDNHKQTNNHKKVNSSTLPNSETTHVETVATITVTSSKKEKLGGFLPNGCIFPRFKNNKHKDKDKESKPKEKEKTLLNALKKSKDKKTTPVDQTERVSSDSDIKMQFDKNCINLENEVQKLDLNKLDSVVSSDGNMFIKLKVTNSSGASK